MYDRWIRTNLFNLLYRLFINTAFLLVFPNMTKIWVIFPISKTTDPLLKTEKNHCSDIKLISSAGDTARSQALRLLKGTFKLTSIYNCQQALCQ